MLFSRKRRLEAAYRHEPMDRPAVYVRAGFPAGDSTYNELKDFLRNNTAQKKIWSANKLLSPLPVVETVEPFNETHEKKTLCLHTPGGVLKEVSLIGIGGNPSMVTEHFLKGPEDALAYLSLPARIPSGNTDDFFMREQEPGDTGIVDCSLGFNPAGTAAALFGSETFALMSVTRRELLHRLMRRRTEVILAVIDFAFKAGAGEFWSMAGEEYVVPPLHGPDDFDDFNARYDRVIINRLRERDHHMHIHCHGSVKKVINRVAEIGTAVFHPFEAPPSGDITPKEAKQASRSRMTLEGNIQISSMYNGTPREIYEETQNLIHDTFDDGTGLIVCPSASPYIPGRGIDCLEQFKAMTDAAVNWKK
jgi:hypothetical protein